MASLMAASSTGAARSELLARARSFERGASQSLQLAGNRRGSVQEQHQERSGMAAAKRKLAADQGEPWVCGNKRQRLSCELSTPGQTTTRACKQAEVVYSAAAATGPASQDTASTGFCLEQYLLASPRAQYAQAQPDASQALCPEARLLMCDEDMGPEDLTASETLSDLETPLQALYGFGINPYSSDDSAQTQLYFSPRLAGSLLDICCGLQDPPASFTPVPPESLLSAHARLHLMTEYAIALGTSYFTRLCGVDAQVNECARSCVDFRPFASSSCVQTSEPSAKTVGRSLRAPGTDPTAWLLALHLTCVHIAAKFAENLPCHCVLQNMLCSTLTRKVSVEEAFQLEMECLFALDWRVGAFVAPAL